jgi:hypothetical protein
MRAKTWMRRLGPVAAVVTLLAGAMPADAQQPESQRFFKKGNFDGMSEADFKAAYPEFFGPATAGRTRPNAIPDIFGPGAVLNVGSVNMKVSNYGFFGNPFTNLSSDPAGQWPGSSGVEYLNFVGLAVGAVNPLATDPSAVRRVSYITEWRPQTLDPEDRIYRGYDGIINGTRFVNDDNDADPFSTLQNPARIDEDFLDGRDNDGDGRIDEDFAAIGQQMYSCVVWDNTPQAINAAAAERHVPLGMECRQLAWAYSIPGFSDFNVVEWTLFNRSGHVLDSLVVGGVVDMDCGPSTKSNYFNDDVDMGSYPSGEFAHITSPADRRLQDSTMRAENEPAGFNTDSLTLCPRFPIRVNGFSVADDDGDENLTPGVPSFMLVDHTIDPLGVSGPSRVGFKSFRAYVGGTPYNQGGRPAVDQQRFELMIGTEPNNINEDTGFIDWPLGDQHGDWVNWWSVGPWRNVPDGGSVKVTVAFGVQPGRAELGANYASDYTLYQGGAYPGGGGALFEAYPSLENAYAIQVAFEGIYEDRADWPLLTNGHGRETMIKPGPGQPSVTLADCHDIDAGRQRTVTSSQPDPDWFDFDCSYCTGVYDSKQGRGMFHRTWNADAPPPSPNLNISVNYNYSDNPDRTVAPGGDNTVNLAWDNLSEVSADPKSGWFDFRGYRVWKVSNWTRPVGSAGPNDDDWALVGEFRQFQFRDAFTNLPIASNQVWQRTSPTESTLVCPRVFIPNYRYPDGHRDTATVEICLNAGDLWDRQTGQIIRPDSTVTCVGAEQNLCDVHDGCINGRTDCGQIGNHEQRTFYKIGRYKLVDHEVKNGFVYFYSVTAFDSTGSAGTRLELTGRRAAVEAEGVVPQVSTRAGRQAWVVPNPYRGYSRISDRPSSWDLTPNAGDPTGTHIDFLGLPSGRWTVRVYTVSGDLVTELKSSDPVNQSIRSPVTGADGRTRDGSNLQQDNPNDGQARWNLISRNGQDIVSGVYIFTVDSDQGTQRGKFVVIR